MATTRTLIIGNRRRAGDPDLNQDIVDTVVSILKKTLALAGIEAFVDVSVDEVKAEFEKAKEVGEEDILADDTLHPVVVTISVAE